MALRTRLIAIAFAGLTVATAVHAQEDGTVRLLRVEATASGARVVLSGDLEVPRYAVRSRDEGRVVVLEVAGAEPAADGMTVRGSAPLIERTTSSQTDRGLRLELGLRAEVNHRVEASPGQIVLLLDRVGAPSPHGAGGGEVLTVSGVHVEQRDGRDRVVVQLSGPGEFRVRERPGEASRLFIADATLEGGVDQSLRVDDRRMGAVRGVEVRQDERRVVVEVDRDRRARGTAIREGDRIVWLFTVPRATTGRPAARTVARDPDLFAEDAGDGAAETEVVSEEVAAFLTDVPLQIGRARDDRRYRGRRIDLDFHNADIHNILRLIAEVGGVNIVTSDDVEGTITIRMRNVPWDQALDVILQAKGLGMVRRGNLIRVAPLEALEKEREAAIARQKQQIQLAPLETRLIPVSYATADELSPRVQELLTERGSVSVDERTNVLIVRDTIQSLDEVEELVRMLDTQTPQVLVEARIVEANSQYTREVGIQWGGYAIANTATGNPTGLTFPANIGLQGGNFNTAGGTGTPGLTPFGDGTVANPNFAVNLPAQVTEGSGGAIGLTLGSLNGAVNINVRLSALEENGVVRIISSPRILTLDNSEASISQGTLIPYSQISAQGVQTAFQEAILELRVTPHVTADGSVAMAVKVTRNEPDFTRISIRGDPTILKREAETRLLVEDGRTAVIGGIFTRNSGRNVDQVPFFGDIPILGVLFQRRQVRDERSELLIFLTPRIVNRAEALRR